MSKIEKIIIYSAALVAGLIGRYIDPEQFAGETKSATLVYTDDEAIKTAYEELGVEVLPIPGNETKEPPNDKDKTKDLPLPLAVAAMHFNVEQEEILAVVDPEKIVLKKNSELNAKTIKLIEKALSQDEPSGEGESNDGNSDEGANEEL